MKAVRVLVVLGLLVFLSACSSGQNGESTQGTPTEPSHPQISLEGIETVRWGSDTQAVESSYGSPDRRDHPRGKKQVLAYIYENGTFRDYPARRIFYFAEGDGLILIALKVPLDAGEDCVSMFKSFSSLISQANPSIQPTIYRENESEKPFCEAVREGDAHWEKGWILPESGSMGVLTLDPGSSRIELAFVSSAYRQYITRVRH